MDETIALILAGKHPHKKNGYRLEAYDKFPFFSVDITEDVVESDAQKNLGSLRLGGKDPATLQGWILKFGEYSEKLCTSVEIVFD